MRVSGQKRARVDCGAHERARGLTKAMRWHEGYLSNSLRYEFYENHLCTQTPMGPVYIILLNAADKCKTTLSLKLKNNNGPALLKATILKH